MAKAKRVIWCTSLHGLYIKLFLSMKTPPKIANSPCQETQFCNRSQCWPGDCVVNSTCSLQMLTLFANQGHSIVYYDCDNFTAANSTANDSTAQNCSTFLQRTRRESSNSYTTKKSLYFLPELQLLTWFMG